MKSSVVDSALAFQEDLVQGLGHEVLYSNLLADIIKESGSREGFIAAHPPPILHEKSISIRAATKAVNLVTNAVRFEKGENWVQLSLKKNTDVLGVVGLLEPAEKSLDTLVALLQPLLNCVQVLITMEQSDLVQRIATEQIKNQQQSLLAAVDAASEGVWEWNIATDEVNFSESWLQNFGWEPGEIRAIGQLRDIYHHDDRERVAQTLQEHLDGKTLKFEAEHRMRRKDGSYASVIGRGRVVAWDLQRHPLRFVGTNTDLSQQKKIQRDLMEVQKGMIESAKFSALGVMAAGVAHEINNPLAIIQAYSEVLQNYENLNPVKLEKSRQAILRSVDRIARIVRGLRKVARDGDGDPFEIIKLKTLLEDILSFSQERILHRGISFQTKFSDEIILRCQPVQMSQVILNMLNNSIDAVEGQTHPWVLFEAQNKEDQVVLRFFDSGPPIPEKVRAQIFEPFFTTKQVGKGTGLGLSISRAIIQDHGGRFYLSPDSKVTCFVMELPRAALQATA